MSTRLRGILKSDPGHIQLPHCDPNGCCSGGSCLALVGLRDYYNQLTWELSFAPCIAAELMRAQLQLIGCRMTPEDIDRQRNRERA